MTAPDELDAVYRRLFPKLVGLVSLYCGDRWVAEEIAQETLSRLWARSPETTPDSPDAWTYRVAMNLANSWFRRRAIERRARDTFRAAPPDHDHSDPDDFLAVSAALRHLPPRQRQAVVLRYFADLSVEETARAMRCAPGTVKAHTHKALAELARSGLVELEPADD
jgi:RNA polymerase sigma factor (sigma-70 family)